MNFSIALVIAIVGLAASGNSLAMPSLKDEIGGCGRIPICPLNLCVHKDCASEICAPDFLGSGCVCTCERLTCGPC